MTTATPYRPRPYNPAIQRFIRNSALLYGVLEINWRSKMRFTDFIKELDDAGWQGIGDAQHKNIEYLHRKLFPVIAELEDENVSLAEDIMNTANGG